ncbi:MAG: T9SS type A sorting domain-containing protein [Flavobacterium piscis]|nr:T9SS type A sorting domain-containing protein [Flavobacterium piscis]
MTKILHILFFLPLAFSSQIIFAQGSEKLSIQLFSYLNDFQTEKYSDDYQGETINPVGIMIYDTTTNPESVWEIAYPNKGNWTEGTGPNWPNPTDLALLTDSIDPYPTNNVSEINFIVDKPEWAINQNRCWSNFSFSFRYKCETDTLLDGIEIFVSLDGGTTYANAMSQEDILELPNAPTLIDGHFSEDPGSEYLYGISGTTSTYDIISGWGQAGFYFEWDQGHEHDVQSARVKLVFKSDGIQTNKRGFIIDGINISVVDMCNIIEVPHIKSDDIKLYPNPATNDFTVSLDGIDLTDLSIQLYNSLGQQIMNEDLSINNKIDCKSLQSGIYYYRISSKGTLIKNEKLIISK